MNSSMWLDVSRLLTVCNWKLDKMEHGSLKIVGFPENLLVWLVICIYSILNWFLQVVIGNLLETRKTEVVVITECEEKWIRIENATMEEIEKHIVEELVHRHTAHIVSSSASSWHS